MNVWNLQLLLVLVLLSKHIALIRQKGFKEISGSKVWEIIKNIRKYTLGQSACLDFVQLLRRYSSEYYVDQTKENLQ